MRLVTACVALAALFLLAGTDLAVAQTSFSARPSGKIAFISEGAIEVMNADGSSRMKVCGVDNAKGRLSFSPDNKKITFSREGKDVSSLPSGEGGGHLLHDVFITYLDSARTNVNWWHRITNTLGAYQPEWSPDGSMIYCQNDANAGNVDFIIPSHQLAAIEPEGGNMEYLRKDWQRLNMIMLMPSVSPDGTKVAYAIAYSPDPNRYTVENRGIKVVAMADIMKSETEMRQPTPGLNDGVAPAWSPDGKWLAYVTASKTNAALIVIKADMTEKRTVFASTPTQSVSLAAPGWSPDSKWLTFATYGDAGSVINIIDINGQNLTAVTGAGKFSNPAWSR
ncbi:MAG: hypothetical protein PHR28_11955 [candidate division Zixibacteria bacterium]|nr:hypothetical protein [candidate division Zixibacteria bacterium]